MDNSAWPGDSLCSHTRIAVVDDVTQQNAALVEEAAAASESMKVQAGNLSESVGVFRLAEAVGTTARNGAERRGPNRAANVSRIAPSKPAVKPGASFAAKPASASAARPVARPAPAARPQRAAAALTGTDGGDWEAF